MLRRVAEFVVPDASKARSAFSPSAPETIGTTIIHVTICKLYKTLIFKDNSSLRMPRNSPHFMHLEPRHQVHSSPLLVPIPSHINPVDTLPAHYLRNEINTSAAPPIHAYAQSSLFS